MFWMKTYVVGTHWKYLDKVLLISTHNICCYGEIRKISTISSCKKAPYLQLWMDFLENWYWLTVGQGLLFLQQVRVQEECFYFFCFFTFIHFPLSSLSLPFISSITCISSIPFLPFSGRRHKMTHMGWCIVKPQHNQSINLEKGQRRPVTTGWVPAVLATGGLQAFSLLFWLWQNL